MSTELNPEFYRGPVDESGEHIFNQTRLERDFILTQRIQNGYTPAEPTDDNPRPRIIDGTLNSDAQEALSCVWTQYEPSVSSIARKKASKNWRKPTISYDDLLQEGFFGVYQASLTWNPSKNITFLTMVNKHAMNYMNMLISTRSTTIRTPIHLAQTLSRLDGINWGIYQERGRQPRKSELAEITGMSTTKIGRLLVAHSMTREMGSLDRGFFEDERDGHSLGGRTLDSKMHPISPSATEAQGTETEALAEHTEEFVLDEIFGEGSKKYGVTEREKEVLRLRYIVGMSFEEVGRHFGVTRERIRQIEIKAKDKIRDYGNSTKHNKLKSLTQSK